VVRSVRMGGTILPASYHFTVVEEGGVVVYRPLASVICGIVTGFESLLLFSGG